MKTQYFPVAVLAAALFGSTSLQTAFAELPSLNDAPWMGYFAAFKGRNYQIGVTAHGKTTLMVMNEKGEPLSHSLSIPITFGIAEILPDGKAQMKKIKADSLESSETATDNLEKTVIRGKVTGDAAFEVTIEQERDVISIGGRVTDPGSLKKNPLHFAVRVKIPNAYPYEKKETRKELKAFEKKIRGDRIELKLTDGKRSKHSFDKPVDLTSKEINGPGIASAEVEINSYKGKKLYFSASENSAITLLGSKPAPLHEGFFLNWSPDAAKDPQGKSRFSFLVK